jgi:hypothetical protein
MPITFNLVQLKNSSVADWKPPVRESNSVKRRTEACRSGVFASCRWSIVLARFVERHLTRACSEVQSAYLQRAST